MEYIVCKTAALSISVIVLTACSSSSLQQDELSFAQKQALDQISDLITQQCHIEGFASNTKGFDACYWNLAGNVRTALLDRQELALLESGTYSYTADDRQANRFRNQDNADARLQRENSRDDRAQADRSRGLPR